jgi:ABC-type sulfate transport system permease component
MPLAVYSALQTDIDAAIALSIIMLAISFIVLIALHLFAWRGDVSRA